MKKRSVRKLKKTIDSILRFKKGHISLAIYKAQQIRMQKMERAAILKTPQIIDFYKQGYSRIGYNHDNIDCCLCSCQSEYAFSTAQGGYMISLEDCIFLCDRCESIMRSVSRHQDLI